MKIVLLGANGRTGREVLTQALEAGDTVTAVVRSADKLADMTHSQLNVQVADVFDPEALKKILPGNEVVISTLGPRMPTQKACRIYSESARPIVEAMQECRVNRLLTVSTALLFPSNTFLDRVLGFIARHNARAAASMEDTILASQLQWTIARVGFLNNKSSTKFRFAAGTLPEGGNSISRAALASFLLKEAKHSDHLCRVVGLSE